jgi:hypothetical protein
MTSLPLTRVDLCPDLRLGSGLVTGKSKSKSKVKVKVKGKIKSKGSGQECPLHTKLGDYAACEFPLISAQMWAR